MELSAVLRTHSSMRRALECGRHIRAGRADGVGSGDPMKRSAVEPSAKVSCSVPVQFELSEGVSAWWRGRAGGAWSIVMSAHATESPLAVTVSPRKPAGAVISRSIEALSDVSGFTAVFNAESMADFSRRGDGDC